MKGTDTKHVKLSVYSPPGQSRPLFKEATSHTFTPTKVGASFGPSWSTHWFKVQVTVQGDELRVSGKKRDDLQSVIQHLKGLSLDQPLQYVNFRD